ncbi:MAG: NUDIX hydrolase [Chloroflexi bacterium]|nr:NUDIX hydrolase [Chloroflexota bacterium]
MPDNQLFETEIGDETIYKGRIVNLHVQRVRLPNGKEAKREIVFHSGAVAIVPLLPGDQTILVRQFRKPAGKVLLEVPAGTLNPQEDLQSAANRELREETGYQAHSWQRMGGIFVAPGYSTEYIHLYLASDLTRAPLQADDDEFIETINLPLQAAIEKIYSGEIEDAKTVSGLLMAIRFISR